jgi:hypothetical protein
MLRGRFLASRYSPTGQRDLVSYDTMGIGASVVMTPPLDDDRLPPPELANAYSYVMCVSPDGNRIGLDYVNAGRVDMIDLSGKGLQRAAVPFVFRPTLTAHPTTHKLIYAGQGRRGYGKCVATPTHLFSLFRGNLRTATDLRASSQPGASYIHVFDWDGNLVRVIKRLLKYRWTGNSV